MKADNKDLPLETMELQMGPSHPASHGTIKFNLKLDGENILDCDVEVGFLHRGFEKICEQATWTQVFPYTDRLNYASSLINNVGYRAGRRELLGVEAPERCQYIRVIVSEISRISDHLTCLGMAALRGRRVHGRSSTRIEAREYLYDLIEDRHRRAAHGHLLPHRRRDARSACPISTSVSEIASRRFARCSSDCDKLLLAQPRSSSIAWSGIGMHVAARPRSRYGVTGPLLRATGVDYDVRKALPYLFYDRSISKCRSGTTATTTTASWFACTRSSRACASSSSASRSCPSGRSDQRSALRVAAKKRSLQQDRRPDEPFQDRHGGHPSVPAGEVYLAVEGGNGELGFYLVSDGSGRPYRVRVRPPCFYRHGRASRHDQGHMIADIIPTFGMINMIGGECDR